MTSHSDPFQRPEVGPVRRLAVLGAGPVGLDAALAARDAGFALRVYEAGPHPAAHVRQWGHVRLFSPWSMNLSDRMREGLTAIDRPLEVDPDVSPTGSELVDRVFDPLWSTAFLSGALHIGTRVLAVGRQGTLKHEEIASTTRASRPFRILVRDETGTERTEFADLVLDCTGKFGNPNTLGDGGIPAPGERALERRIERWLPDLDREAERWTGGTTLLVGGGHSAQTAVRALDALARRSPGTRVIWAMRREDPELGADPDDPLPLRRELVAEASRIARGDSAGVEPELGVVVDALESAPDGVSVRLRRGGADVREIHADRILALTGGVGDAGIYRQLQVHECYATSGPMKLSAALLGSGGGDCLAQESHGVETLMNPEPGFFILGDKSYGRNNTFLLQVGWSQVDEVFAAIGGGAPPGPSSP